MKASRTAWERIARHRWLILPLILAATAVAACLIYSQRAVGQAEARAYQVAGDSAAEQLATFKAALNGRFFTLEAYAKIFAGDGVLAFDDPQTLLRLANAPDGSFISALHISKPDGTTYGASGTVFNVSDRAYFLKSMAGERAIERVDSGRVTGAVRFILSVPVAAGGEVIGVLEGIFDEKALSDLLVSQAYGGEGYSFFCNAKGEIVIGVDDSEQYRSGGSNLFQRLAEPEVCDAVAADLRNGVPGSTAYTIDGQTHFAVYRPSGVNDWTLFNVLPDSVIRASVDQSRRTSYVITAAMTLIFSLMTLYVIHTDRRVQRLVEHERDALSARNAETDAVIRQSGKYLMRYDLRAQTARCYQNTAAMFNVPEAMAAFPESLLQSAVVPQESRAELARFFAAMRDGVPDGGCDVRLLLAAGSVRWFHADYILINDRDGVPAVSIVSLYDNTEARERELAYELRKNEIASLISDSIYYLEANLSTDEVETMHGDPAPYVAALGKRPTLSALVAADCKNDVLADDASAFLAFFNKHRLLSLHALGIYADSLEFRSAYGGTLRWHRATIQMVRYPHTDEIKIYVIFKTIDSERREKERLLDMASNDSLTGLLNRETTMQDIERYLLDEGAQGVHALFMVDIDDFKAINDTYGHQAGDTVLNDLAQAIRRSFRASDIVGRIGGDEFFAFMKNAARPGAVEQKARELVAALQYVYAGDGGHRSLSGSIGITIYRGAHRPAKTLQELYAEADAALYRAKSAGKNCYAFADAHDEAVVPAAGEGRGALGLSLHSLLNNIGSGIGICHGTPEGQLTPLFCNASFFAMLGGLSGEEFFAVYGRDVFAGVHPEDLRDARAAYDAARQAQTILRHTCRIQGAGGSYFWVSFVANFIFDDDGGFDLYAVCSDAGQTVCEQAALEERFRHFQSCRRMNANGALVSFRLNLTANACGECIGDAPAPLRARTDGTADDLLERICACADAPEERARCQTSLSRGSLLALCAEGEPFPALECRFRLGGERVVWLRVTAEMMRNPETRDVEALLCCFDVDRGKRLQLMIERLLATDYEFLGEIDVATGRVCVLGGNTPSEMLQAARGGVPYDDELPLILSPMVREEFLEESVRALRLSHLVDELKRRDFYTCAFPARGADGRERFKQWRCSYMDGRRDVILISRTDVTEAVSNERDVLTGLYNQQGFYRRVREQLNDSAQGRFRLLRVDVDNFKMINETLGYEMGDQLLRDLGAALRGGKHAAADCLFARLEADHFVSCMPDEGDSAETIFARLSNWLRDYPINFQVMAHMGVYRIDEPGTEVSVMCDRALLALKSIKNSYSQRVAYYSDELRCKLVEEQALAAEMAAALAGGQFEVHFQPQVNYVDGSLIGTEALVRWKHPVRGEISPAAFIPLFERNGFISALDEYVWEKSCQYMKKWQNDNAHYASVPVSVNISRIDIYNARLCETLCALVQKYGLPPRQLKLEITESVYMQNPEQLVSVVKKLQGAGFVIEMDDFGSGYSSLNTLKDVRVDVLKLDMRFLAGGEDDARGGSILSSVIRMAHWLKLPVIAEGVETRAQADYLKSLGCFYMQGFYFDGPMPAERFEVLLQTARLGRIDRYSNVELSGVAAFWDPSAQTALLFNSFVGGAAIMEYHNQNAEILRANDKFYSELMTTREAYLDKQLHTLDRFDAPNRAIYMEMLESAIRTGGEAECDLKSQPQAKGAPPFWTHNRVRLLSKNGDSCLLYLSTENITARKQMEEQLRINREALQLSIAQTGRTVCHYDVAARTLTLPEEYAKKHGVPTVLRDIPDRPRTVIPDDHAHYRAFYERILRGERTGTALVRDGNADGKSYTWERLNFVTVFSAESEPVGAIVTIEDVTAQKEREAEHTRNSLVVEQTGISVLNYDVITDTLCFHTNTVDRGIVEMDVTGYYDYLVTAQSLVHPEDRRPMQALLYDLVEGRSLFGSRKFRCNSRGVGYRWSRIDYSCMKDREDRVYRIVGQITDIQKETDDSALIARLNERLAVKDVGYPYNNTIVKHAFLLFFGTDAPAAAIESVLTFLGEQYDLSRVSLFENDAQRLACAATFEWCAPGVAPQKDRPWARPCEASCGGAQRGFDGDGVFFCPDAARLSRPQSEALAQRGVRSMLQCAIMDGGAPVGCINFDECREGRLWSDEQLGTLLIVARIVGAFLLKLRKSEQAECSADFLASLDDSTSFIYIVDPDTHEVIYSNRTLREDFGSDGVGSVCYRAFLGRETPCESCPIRALNETGEARAVEVLRPNGTLLLTQASPLHWNGRSRMMISCIDVTESKRLRRALDSKATSLRALYDTLPCGILQYTLRGEERTDLSCNRAILSILGYADEQTYLDAVRSRADDRRIYPEDRAAVCDRLARVAKQNGRVEFEHRVLLEGGGLRWVRVALQIDPVAGEDARQVQLVYFDITEQRLNDVHKFSDALIALYDEIYELDFAADSSTIRFSRFAPSENIGVTMPLKRSLAHWCTECVCPEDQARVREAVLCARGCESGAPNTVEYGIVMRGGVSRRISMTLLNVGKDLWLMCNTDVTGRSAANA